MSLYLIMQHALHYTKPREQKQFVAPLGATALYRAP